MNKRKDAVSVLAQAATEPDLYALKSELAEVLGQAAMIRDRQMKAMNTRLCRWDGQSTDYRRHAVDIGDDAKPFEGAPDMRVPVADQLVRERVALYVETLMSSEIQAVPIGGLDEAEGALRVTRMLKWLRNNRLQLELLREAELLANHVEGDDPGVGVLKVWWRQEVALEMRELSVEDVATQLLQARGVQLAPDGNYPPQVQGAIDDVSDLIFNPARESELVEIATNAFPSVLPKRIRKAVRELRKTGQTQLPVPYLKASQPSVTALRYMNEVFFRKDVDDIQKNRVIYEVERLTEPELRARVHTHGWDAAWVEEVIEKGPGPTEMDGRMISPPSYVRSFGYVPAYSVAQQEIYNLYEVWHAYTRAADDYGIPGIYWTVFSGRVRDSWGWHELMDTPDGDYPFVDLRSEIISRGIENARGTPERAGSFQYEIKRMRDSRGAAEMLATLPPVRVAMRRGGLEAALGPMVEVPVRAPDDVTWMTPPPFPNNSIEMEKAAKNDLNEYFGRMVPGVSAPELAQALLQHDVNRWLGSWVIAFGKVLMLQQKFGDPGKAQLVAGAPMEDISPEQIRGRYQVLLKFSVRDLNMDFVISRNQAIASLSQLDRGGVIDYNTIVRAGMRAIDPALAEQGVKEGAAATMQEVSDEQNCVNQMAVGIEPPLRQTGVNATLRLQTLHQTVKGSPTLARRYFMPANDDDANFKKLVDNRAKNLGFLVQQFQMNPQIGRQGTLPLQQTVAGAAGTN